MGGTELPDSAQRAPGTTSPYVGWPGTTFFSQHGHWRRRGQQKLQSGCLKFLPLHHLATCEKLSQRHLMVPQLPAAHD